MQGKSAPSRKNDSGLLLKGKQSKSISISISISMAVGHELAEGGVAAAAAEPRLGERFLR